MCICICPTIINTATARSQGNKSEGCAQQLGRQRKAFAYRKRKKEKNQRTLKEMKHKNCLQRKSTQEREEERKRKQA
jgi:hypothetical protein